MARRHGINTNQLFLWRRQLREGAQALADSRRGGVAEGEFSFVPLVPVQTGMVDQVMAQPSAPAGMIEVMAAGMTVRVPPGADEASLRLCGRAGVWFHHRPDGPPDFVGVADHRWTQ